MRFRRCILMNLAIIVVLLFLLGFMQYCISNEIATNISTNEGSQFKYSKCEVIHIGVVCTGYGYNLHFYTMLKSLYYFRNNPLHFHIIVDDVSGNILRTMFETWTVPEVSVSFYDVKSITSDFWWMPEYQYYPVIPSKLLKFTFPKAVSIDIASKIIVIDPDIIFVSDIYNLWNVFDNFNKNQVIGFVKYRNSDYTETNIQQLNPEDEEEQRSYSADVTLYNLKRLKTNGLAEKLFNIVNNTFFSFGETKVTEQEVVNAILDKSSSLVYHIPSYLSSQLKNSYGYYNTTKVKIVGSSEINSNPTNTYDNYEKMYQTILNYNGSLLRQRQCECTENSENVVTVKSINDDCSDFHDTERDEWTTLLFVKEFKHNVTGDDLTFVSQLSYSRRHVVEELGALWKGPISLTVYVTDSELHDFINFIENSRFLQNRFNIAYHVVFKDGDNYPINVLRNIALRHVITPYVFLVDIDFLPMPDLYPILKKYLSSNKNMENKALIVAAFQTKKYLPTTKNELLAMWDNGTILPFYESVYRRAHAPTNYQKWTITNDTYQVAWKPDFEPYIVVARNVTEYDERFFGYGGNKVSHIMELKAQGYQFLVLSNVFIVHKPHKRSDDKSKFAKSQRFRKCVRILKSKFIKEMNKKYGNKRLKEVVY